MCENEESSTGPPLSRIWNLLLGQMFSEPFLFNWEFMLCSSKKKKKHFHPPEHICIQSKGRNNAIHCNCMLSLARVNADLRGSAGSFSQPGCLCWVLDRVALNLLQASAALSHTLSAACFNTLLRKCEQKMNNAHIGRDYLILWHFVWVHTSMKWSTTRHPYLEPK